MHEGAARHAAPFVTRDAWLVAQGVRVLRYPAKEMLTNLEGVVRQIIAIASNRRDGMES